MMPPRPVLIVLLAFLISASGGLSGCKPGEDKAASSSPATPVRVQETYQTPRDTTDNVDSAALWHGPGGEHWLFATAKGTHALLVFDAATGEPLRRVGGSGSGPGRLARPNGIAVVDSLLLVVERDNARVQVFTLPTVESLGFIGDGVLKRPYGLTVFGTGENAHSLYVTDNYQQPELSAPGGQDDGGVSGARLYERAGSWCGTGSDDRPLSALSISVFVLARPASLQPIA